METSGLNMISSDFRECDTRTTLANRFGERQSVPVTTSRVPVDGGGNLLMETQPCLFYLRTGLRRPIAQRTGWIVARA